MLEGTRSARPLLHGAAKPLLFAVCLLPFAWLFYAAWSETLGPNPAEALIRATGGWTLRFLCLTLAITPLRHWTGQVALARFRRRRWVPSRGTLAPRASALPTRW